MCFLLSFESWFDIDSLGEAENVVAVEREQNILSMLHQVCLPNELPNDNLTPTLLGAGGSTDD